MEFSVLTYNTLFGKGKNSLQKIITEHKPDIICLQEIATSRKSLKEVEALGYKLADYSNSFIKSGSIYGVATFYNPDKFQHKSSNSVILPFGIFDMVAHVIRILKMGRSKRSTLISNFRIIASNKTITTYNIHLTCFGANSIRLKQLHKTMTGIDMNIKNPTVLVGDFNYPYHRKKLEKLMSSYGFKEASNTIYSTMHHGFYPNNFAERFVNRLFIKVFNNLLKLDYVFYKNCRVISSQTLNIRFSDHLPIISRFSF